MTKRLEILQSALGKLASKEITKIALPLGKLVIRKEYPPDLAGTADITEHYPWLKDLPDSRHIDFDSFLSDNIRDLNIIDDFADGRYKKLGKGGEGIAYLIGRRSSSDSGGYVLKIQHSTNTPEDPESVTKSDIKSLHEKSSDKDLVYQPMIYANGIFDVLWNPYLGYSDNQWRSAKIGILWWKIMEKVDTEWWNKSPLDKPKAEAMYWNHIRKILTKMSWLLGQASNKPFTSDLVAADILNLKDATNRDTMAKTMEPAIRSMAQITDDLVAIDEVLKPGWLKDFIASYLFQVGVKRRMDFAPQNFGIREGTGTIVWFDA